VKKFIFAAAAFGALVAPALGADMPLKARSYVAPPALWMGWYVGANVGWAGSQNSVNSAATPVPDAALGVVPGVSEGLAALSTGAVPAGSRSGFIGGGQAGYNWQFGNWVAGIETDIQGIAKSSGSGSVTRTAVVVGVPVTSTQTASLSTEYLGTVRGRLGFLVTPTWLLYATGGLAYGGANASTTLFQTGPGFVGVGAGSLSDARAGWTAGGGFEWMFAQRWSAKAEYLHYDLGTGSSASASTSGAFATPVYQNVLYSAHFEGNVVRAGVNYHF
jgi:outer membrane immunogenic protein